MADTDDTDRHMRNADALVLQGQMAQEPDAQDHCYAQAFDLYVKVEAIEAGSAAWKLACVAAYRKKPEIAQLWLKRAAKFDGLPDVEEVESHYAFKHYRGQKWFKSIFLELKKKAKK